MRALFFCKKGHNYGLYRLKLVVAVPEEGADLSRIPDNVTYEQCKEQVLQWISEGKFDTSGLPYEVWPVSKCKEAFEYQEKAGEDCFKILFDWSK